MRKPCIPELIYQKTFPKPKQGEPVSFYAHIQRHIVGEVRVEVQTYYGALDTLEAQYPGLDYTYPPHRRRMSRYPWHRRLFRVFDELGLTDNEILNLCQWEGTRAAKERYEREAHIEVKTTTAHDVVAAPLGEGPRARFEDWSQPAPEERSSDGEMVVQVEEKKETASNKSRQPVDCQTPTPTADLFESIRDAIHSRFREAGRTEVNQAWEQWLKDALEQHGMDVESALTAIQNPELDLLNLNPARESPEPLRFSREITPLRSPAPNAQSTQNRTYSELHTMVDELQTNNSQLAADNAALALFLRRTRTQTEAAR
ncbi:uncharacterized protein Z518_09877 [Rhinocladiella mackenziei CBS 650.93]|uniref:Uncharacterized protein n=1 Tax=Rhinocladiella mackenziei CBS 650.93 TaxID=1442369 RepID=A0A0D2FFL7_9EURO|nr:uncharacterized protein Z518_09877 [Rhinocladiella mackenziei CBS 650.93]KIX00812.1 hypothetical protein Z518_09877 [Rhinocladiella mackenziei CBS 650.93]